MERSRHSEQLLLYQKPITRVIGNLHYPSYFQLAASLILSVVRRASI